MNRQMNRQLMDMTVFYNEVELVVECEVSFYREQYYGADADGNRGEPMTFLEDFTILSVKDVDGNDVKNINGNEDFNEMVRLEILAEIA